MAEPVGVSVLGPVQITRGGAPVPLPRLRRSVLAALVAAAPHPVSIDVLMEAAWGRAQPEHPRAALYNVVSRLRGQLGAATIRSQPPGYRLVGADELVDVALFDRLCDRAAAAPSEQAAALLDRALRLWRGPAYGEQAELACVESAAERVQERHWCAIEDRAALALDLGDPVTAVRLLDELVREQPFRDQAEELRCLRWTGRDAPRTPSRAATAIGSGWPGSSGSSRHRPCRTWSSASPRAGTSRTGAVRCLAQWSGRRQ